MIQAEIEVKFLDINHDQMRDKLRALGAVCESPMRDMKRVVIDNHFMRSGKDAFVRIRDEGDKVTMTYKQFDSLSVDGAKEIEIIVSDFDKTLAIFEQMGLPHSTFQETRRETWKLDDVEVVLDEWPWIKPYMEIEGESEAELKDVAARLGLDWGDAVFGDVMVAYRAEYPHLGGRDTVASIKEVKFGDPLPDILKP